MRQRSACTEVQFRKSSRSGPQGNCTEIGFHKSTRSKDHGCVEVDETGVQVLVRDSKQVGLGGGYDVLSFDPGSWKAFLTHLGR